MWLADLALSLPVPAAWVACDDRNGRRFWHNELTGTSHWVHPVDDYVRATLKTLRSGIDPAVAGGGGAAAKGADGGHRTLRAALAALGGDELDTFPGMTVENGEPLLRLEPLSSRRTFTTPHGEAAVVPR